MENNQQKWVNLSFVAVSLLATYIAFVLATKFSVFLDFEGRVRNLDKILMAASAGMGMLLFLILYKNNTANTFMNETVAELSKVTWPTQNETMKATFAVLVSVTIAGIAFWLVDSLWVYLIGLVI